MEEFFRFDMVDIREESFLKKFACLGMPYFIFFSFFFLSFFFLVFLTAEYRIILPCINEAKYFRAKLISHFMEN